ncbi:MAG: hypothetical protein U1E86_27950 [Burkholderiaceae bacterium]
MPIEILTGSDVPSLLARAQLLIGEDAVVVSVRRILDGRRMGFEMVAADPVTASEQRRRTSLRPVSGEGAGALLRADAAAAPAPVPAEHRRFAPPAPAERRPDARRAVARRPRVVALVGPTGAGKTTTLAKLARHPLAFGGSRVGVLCLDTWRLGAVEQARLAAELAQIPFEVAYDATDLGPALERLSACEIVLVDTPGRGPRAIADLREAQALLQALAPDEVHLVLPAGLQRPLARNMLTAHLPFGVTHLLLTKLDEYADERTVFELARQFGVPMRWVADGQDVSRHLQPAPDTGVTPGSVAHFAHHAEAV